MSKKAAKSKKPVKAKKPVAKARPKAAAVKKARPTKKKKVVAKKAPPARKKTPVVKPPAQIQALEATPTKKFGKPPFPIKNTRIFKTEQHKPAESQETTKARMLNPKFLEQQKKKLLDLRDHILDQMQGVAQDNLRSRPEGNENSAFGMHQADAGSDAYEKDFALSLLSQEQDALYEIEEALKRVDLGGYGTCEMSGKAIPITRLEAIPFARYTVECQAQTEKEQKGRNRWDTAPQFMDSTENFFEEEEESEDEEKSKLKD